MNKATKFRLEMRAPALVSQEAHRQLREHIRAFCGIELDEEKREFMAARLQPLLEKRGLPDADSLCKELASSGREGLLSDLVDAITTNHTYFNREQRHFDHLLETALPDILLRSEQQRSKKLRIWSAACSTGQEAYGLGIVVLEALGENYALWDTGVLATDLNTRALDKARQGRYLSEELARLPRNHLTKYFSEDRPGHYSATPHLRGEILFRRFNLMNPKIPFRSKFDIIFCRNVMLYFDGQSRMRLVHRLTKKLCTGGYLYVGAAEILPVLPDLEAVAPSIYRKTS